eukprot:CAMPEP_0201518272 /NCGR_PEP_ID=MMETSP0161_2-20130828/9169_1 /ASSEMBLY_ACC=CAM_ASM_000251 /TAXON_ID=180227 /ORGANISM="Neoparamoeba aestuarina, Strain SoJaBio B1-5/56/2" /LENGTH=433 /DNA_ID=CAMNT_0047916009 /DNA_START=81 /DNA_END=1378 /DNA_ORIENTATION=-
MYSAEVRGRSSKHGYLSQKSEETPRSSLGFFNILCGEGEEEEDYMASIQTESERDGEDSEREEMLATIDLDEIDYEDDVRMEEENHIIDESEEGGEEEEESVEGEEENKEEPAPRWYNAVIPITTMVVTALIGLLLSGNAEIDHIRQKLQNQMNLAQIQDNTALQAELEEEIELLTKSAYRLFVYADSVAVLVWASFLSALVASFLTILQKLLTIEETIALWVEGSRTILHTLFVLVSSWALSAACQQMKTGDYLLTFVGYFISPGLLPLLVFSTSAMIAFATGSSWATMAISYPIVLPLAWGLDLENYELLQMTSASILSGAVFGGHCSPRSETTLLSSMKCGCDLLQHLRTQVFYATVVAFCSCFFGYLLVGFELYSGWVGIILSSLATFLIIFLFGKSVKIFYWIGDDEWTTEGENEEESRWEKLWRRRA